MTRAQPYLWGTRDCLATFRQAVAAINPAHAEKLEPEIARFHAMSEVAAWATLLDMGGAAAVYTDRLCPPGRVTENEAAAHIGFWDREITIAGRFKFYAAPGAEAMGFRARGAWWHWTPFGLHEIDAHQPPSRMLEIR